MKDPSIFICYSHKDTAYVDRLVTFLDGFQLKGFFKMWDDRQIQHGKEWLVEIKEAIINASIVVLMISADFLASEFIRDQELPEIRRRMEQKELIVLPVICKPCSWKHIDWLAAIQAYPTTIESLSATSEEHERERQYNKIAKTIHDLFEARKTKEATPTDSGEASPFDRDGFYTEAGVINLIKNAPDLASDERIVGDPLLIFRTKNQRTWLVTTNKALFCVLDDEEKRARQSLIRWKQPLSDIDVIETRSCPPKFKNSRYVDIGDRHKGWKYSKSLFPTPEELIEAINTMKEKAKQV